MSQKTQNLAGGSSSGSYDLQSIYKEAMDQLQSMRDAGQLSSADYNIITSTKPDEVLLPVEAAKTMSSETHLGANRIRASVDPLLQRLETFGSVMDKVVEFSPEFMGVDILGIVWGSIKLMMMIARDVSDAFGAVLEVLDIIRNNLPVLDVYIELFSASSIQLLKGPLVEIYTHLLLFVVQAVKLFHRSMLRTLAKSTSTSLTKQFQSLSENIAKASREVDRIANVEHMYQTDQALKVQALENAEAKSFRMEERQRHDHSGAARTEGHPLPSLLPFNDAPVDLLSPCFTGRHVDVQFIANILGSPTGHAPARYAIWGMPGLGKSQTVLQYAHLSFESERHTHIFWIQATTVEKLTHGLASVLDLVQHPERHNSDQAAQLMAARGCFEHSQKYGFVKWLIIFDNATPETVSFLRQNLPRQNANGSILITTRTLDVAEALTNVAGQQHPVCELKALSPVHSAELLLKRAGIHGSATADLESAQELVQRMGCLPLAVEQTGAFMKANGFGSANRLNNMYDQHGSAEIVRWENNLTTYEQTSVLAAFTAPLQRLGTINPNVLSLLRVLACFDPEHIPLDIVVLGADKARAQLALHAESTSTVPQAPKNKRFGFRRLITKLSGKRATPRLLTVLQSGTLPLELVPLLDSICSEEWLRRACGHLKDLSLAQPLYGEKTSLHIHDLIQQVVFEQTTAAHESGENMYHAFAVTLLSQAFSTIEDPGSPQSWAECERFVPHLMSLVSHAGALPINLLGVLSVRVARYFVERARYEEAAALCQHALAGQTQQLGADHLDTLNTVHHLADVYECQAKYTEAEALYQRALAGREQQLGADHRDTLGTINNLAILHKSQGKYDDAQALYRRALAGREKQLGADHPDTLRTVNNLAFLYCEQGKYIEAEPLYQRALAGREKQLGADHPDTLETVNNLAELYREQGKYDEAEPLYQRALAAQTQQLGADHPSTLLTVNNLALLYYEQGKYIEAEPLYQRALAGQTQQLGASHPNTLTAAHNIALLYHNQGKYDEAEHLYQQVLAGEEQQLGAGHPSTLTTVNNLADLYRQQEKYDEAESLYQRALAGREISLGIHHPDTIMTMKHLAFFYDAQGRDGEAKTMRARAEEAEKVRLSK